MKKQTGFTLVELMITLVLVGVMLTIGVPSLKSFMQRNQLIASTNELLSAIHVARSEAIKLNTSVTICESSDGATCTATGSWENGWIVFVNGAGALASTGLPCAAATNGCLLREHAAFTDTQLTMTGAEAGGAAVSHYTFNSRGLPGDLVGTPQSGSFSVCSLDDSGDTVGSRAVVVSLSGRVRVSDNTNAMVTPCP